MSRSAAARAGSAMIVAACTLIRMFSITCPLTGDEDGWYGAITRDLPLGSAIDFLVAATTASSPKEADSSWPGGPGSRLCRRCRRIRGERARPHRAVGLEMVMLWRK